MTTFPGSPSTTSQNDAAPPADRHPAQGAGASTLFAIGALVSEDMAAAVGALEAALEAARTAQEEAERRLRLHRDQVDDDLAQALAACQDLEAEKLAALRPRSDGDAGLFEDEASEVADVLTLASLHDKYEARIEALKAEWSARLAEQKRELSKQYFAEVQELATAGARAAEVQAQRLRASASSLEALEREVSVRVAQESELRNQTAALTADLHGIRSELAAAHTRIHLLLSSTSWRASRPIRGGGRVLRWLRGR